MGKLLKYLSEVEQETWWMIVIALPFVLAVIL